MLSNLISHSTVTRYNTTHKHTEYNTCRLHAGQDKQIQTSVDFLVKFIYLGVTQIHVSTSVQHFSETSKATRIPAETDIIFQPSKIKCCWSNTIVKHFLPWSCLKNMNIKQRDVCSFHVIIIEIIRGKTRSDSTRIVT